MATLIIASISDRSGKTAVAAALAQRLGTEDSRVAIGKASASDSADNADSGVFASLLPDNPAVSGAVGEIASKSSGSGGSSPPLGTILFRSTEYVYARRFDHVRGVFFY